MFFFNKKDVKRSIPSYSYKNDSYFFPQANDFTPHLFEATHNSIDKVSPIGILAVELLFKTLNRTLQSFSKNSSRDLFYWGSDREYVKKYGEFENVFFFEHGWFPRTTYQMSPDGINYSAHFTNWKFQNNQKTNFNIDFLIKNIRMLFAKNLVKSIQFELPEEFVIFPFQLGRDFNVKLAGSPFSDFFRRDQENQLEYIQFCVDYVSALNLDIPVLFKQHPMDKGDGTHIKLKRKKDILILNKHNLSLIELLNTKRCKGLISVNSNSIHEALIFNVPVKVLGNFLISSEEYINVFGDTKSDFISDPLNNIKIRSYLEYVLSYQWTLTDFTNPLIVKEIIDKKGYVCPFDLRKKYSFIA